MKNKKLLVILSVIFVIIVFLGIFKNNLYKIIYPKTYQEIVSTYAEKYQLEENLVFAVIKAESNFKEKAVSHKNAIGLMQIMEETAKEVAKKYEIEIDLNQAEEELLKVENNIHIGSKYLSILMERYGNKEVAVAAYNAGMGTVDNWIEKGIIKADGSDIEKIPYKETNHYVRKILRNYKMYEELYK
ncbi:MAG: lytic transglycosylase domain-containing protein [Clostridia bacterium]|nr:lytic transglycosylase domain-containing protein [Clostridia bacterium]